jgi:hypothetical protein
MMMETSEIESWLDLAALFGYLPALFLPHAFLGGKSGCNLSTLPPLQVPSAKLKVAVYL